MRQNRPLYTVEEIAQLLGISTSKVYRWIKTGELRTIQLGRNVAVPAASLEQLLADPTDPPAQGPDQSLNEVTIAGRLASEPVSRTSQQGLHYATLRLQVTRPGRADDPFSITVIAFGSRAELAMSLAKDELVRVDGRLGQRHWSTGEGMRICEQRVIADRIQVLAASRSNEAAAS